MAKFVDDRYDIEYMLKRYDELLDRELVLTDKELEELDLLCEIACEYWDFMASIREYVEEYNANFR